MHEKPLILTAAPRAFLERIEARVKLVCVAVWVVCVVTVPRGNVAVVGVYATILLILLALNRSLAGRFVRRFGPGLPAIVLICALLPLFKAGDIVWQWGIISVTREGLDTALRVGSAAVLCLGAVALVWASTPQEALLIGLRGVGAPGLLVGVLGFMLRYLEVLRPELHRLTDARAARTIGVGGPGRLRSGASVIGTLFLRAHDRAERVADAMVARGYTGRLRSLQTPHFHGRDVVVLIVFPAVLIGLRVAVGG